MRFYTEYDGMSDIQKVMRSKIECVMSQMSKARDEDELFDLFCEADDLLTEYFPWDVQMGNDSIEKHYVNCSKTLSDMKSISNGINVTFTNCTFTFNDCVARVR